MICPIKKKKKNKQKNVPIVGCRWIKVNKSNAPFRLPLPQLKKHGHLCEQTAGESKFKKY